MADRSKPQDQARGREASGFSFALEEKDGRLWLAALHRPEWTPICADWLNAEMHSRVRAGRRQLLARALGLAKNPDQEILDATAGLGRDGWTLAALGARVTLCERTLQLYALQRDARARASAQAPEIAARVELLQADAHAVLAGARRWDAVYLDPMYPHRGKSALPQKEMQLLRELTGGDDDADALLAPALACARRRVVVKRPPHAPHLDGRRPALSMESAQARFDIYLAAV
ncbi:MAG TPA: class I SAM-dependent methyltransferase [Nevskiaceae bacterium]|nr:class I SAM-dependent methyltransferase [Nevskiaceae bacterium]